jgi:phosphate transport system substrate-binding protein
MTKSKLLMGASALVAASLAFAGSASAVTPASDYGTGSSLVAPYLNEIENCFGPKEPLDIQGSSPTVPGTQEGPLTSAACLAQHQATYTFHYMSSSSGFGQAAVFTNSPTFAGETISGADYPTLEYGAGDYALAGSDVGIYDNGGCAGSGASAFNVANQSGGNVGACTGTLFPNPLKTYGPVIQVPDLVTAVAFTYNPVFMAVNNAGTVTTSSFNVKVKNKDGSGGLLIDIPTMCGIFNGTITDWNAPQLTALNGKTSLTGGVSLPIELVGRSDSSGTTSIFYRAMAAQCGGANYLAAGGKTLPPGLLSGNVWPGAPAGTEPVVAGKFTTTKGSGNIAAYLGSFDLAAEAMAGGPGTTVTQGKLAYIGPDYVLPAVVNTMADPYSLNVVNLEVKYGTSIKKLEPTAANALLAFGKILPPQTTTLGVYSAGDTANGQRVAPQDWAEPISTMETLSTGVTQPTPLAIPTAGYPVTGTSNLFLYQCYKTAAQGTAMQQFVDYYYTNGVTKKTLNAAGLAALPAAWDKAIVDAFFKNTDALNLSIDNATVCVAGLGAN